MMNLGTAIFAERPVETYDAIVVGGGPAGSSCAARLAHGGLEVAVLDHESFPRTKLCAGWVTPDVLRALELDPGRYPHGLLTFDHLVIHVKALTFRVPTVQHSIRRYEFDDYLLKSSGAAFFVHHARDIRRASGCYTIDDRFRSEYLVGAGGTRCPVYKSLFREANPRAKDLQVVACEQEFPYDWQDPRCHLWFFENGLPGYAWYVPKAGGYLNCGIGAMAKRLKDRAGDIQVHWERFTRTLERERLVRGFEFRPRSYSYYLRSGVGRCCTDQAYIAGDAAGLATVDLGEGIGPAVKSGLSTADAIIQGTGYALDSIAATSADNIVHGRLLRRIVKTALAWKFPTVGRGRRPGLSNAQISPA